MTFSAFLRRLSGLIGSSLLLCGCTMYQGVPAPGNTTQTCENLKQQIGNNDAMYSVPGQYSNSPTVAAQLYKEYAVHQCPQSIEKEEKSPLPEAYVEIAQSNHL